MTVGKLGYNDHGPLHARLTGSAAVQLLELLVAAGRSPDVIASGIGDLDDATLIVLAGGMLHDLGNALHREGQAQNGALLADPVLRRLLAPLYSYLERDRRLTGAGELDRIAVGLTHRDLADIIGTRRESVTLALSSLARDGLIRGEGREIVVLDADAMREAAEM